MNLFETVLDYMLQTEVVVKALARFRENCWEEVRTLDDLERVMARFPEEKAGSTIRRSFRCDHSLVAVDRHPATVAAGPASRSDGWRLGR